MKRRFRRVSEYEKELQRIEAEKARLLERNAALENRLREIEPYVLVDELTEAFRRGYLQPRVSEELERADRSHTPLGLAMIDLDHFKEVNDQFGGHAAGDYVLRMFADVVRKNTRSYDLLFRYGGDEFTVVFPQVSTDNLRARLEHIRIVTAETVFEQHDRRIPMTVSIGGVVCHPHHNIGVEELVAGADQNLYAAKEYRNRVVVSDILNTPKT